MAEPEHSKIIAQVAKDALTPLGFRRSGRSRVWLADHGYWLGVVEFQPSGFSKGSYLNVAAHWLWRPPPHSLSFDYFHPEQSRPFIGFEDAAQFKPLAVAQAQQAAHDSQRLAQLLASIPAIAAALAKGEETFADRPAGWPRFHAAVAAGLNANAVIAQEMFSAVSDSMGERFPSLKEWVAQALQTLRRGEFRSLVRHAINEARAASKLPTWDGEY